MSAKIIIAGVTDEYSESLDDQIRLLKKLKLIYKHQCKKGVFEYDSPKKGFKE